MQEEEVTMNREEEEGNEAVADTTVEQETNEAEEIISTVVEASGTNAPKKVFCVERGGYFVLPANKINKQSQNSRKGYSIEHSDGKSLSDRRIVPMWNTRF